MPHARPDPDPLATGDHPSAGRAPTDNSLISTIGGADEPDPNATGGFTPAAESADAPPEGTVVGRFVV